MALFALTTSETAMKLEGAKVVVVGMARSGVAAVELLREKGASSARGGSEYAGDGRGIDGRAANATPRSLDADLIVLSPGVPADLELVDAARARGVRVIGDLELASWFLQGEIIGITGSNGKTTTTALTGHILAIERNRGAGRRKHRDAARVDGRRRRAPGSGTSWNFRAFSSKPPNPSARTSALR